MTESHVKDERISWIDCDIRNPATHYRGTNGAPVQMRVSSLTMTHAVLEGKVGVVFGVANKRSIAWAIAQAWASAGARLIFNYQGERLKENLEELTSTFGEKTPMFPCDVSSDAEIKTFF